MAVEFYATWDGNTLHPEMGMDRAEAAVLPAGTRLKVKVTKTRSPAHHRALFGALREVFAQWPETARFQPSNEKELRAWLEVMAGHQIVTYADIETENDVKALKIAYAIERKNGNFVWMMKKDGRIAIVRPDSINWESLDQLEYAKVFNAIADVLARETGILLDDVIKYLKKQYQRKAA